MQQVRLDGRLRLIPLSFRKKDNMEDSEMAPARKKRKVDTRSSENAVVTQEDTNNNDSIMAPPVPKHSRGRKRRRIETTISSDEEVNQREDRDDHKQMEPQIPVMFNMPPALPQSDPQLPMMFDMPPLCDRNEPANEVPMMDTEFDLNGSYEELDENVGTEQDNYRAGFACSVTSERMTPLKRNQPRPKKNISRKKSSERNTCGKSNSSCEHKKKLIRLTRQMSEQYRFVPRQIVLQTADDKTQVLDWFSPLSLTFLRDLHRNWLYGVILASGSFKLKGVNVVLGRHQMKFTGLFLPGVSHVDGVCALCVLLSPHNTGLSFS